MTKHKNSKCDKTQNVSKLKMWQNSKLKIWQNSKTQRVTNFKNSNCDKIHQLKLWQNSTTQNSKSQILIQKKFWQKTFVKNNLTPWQPMRCIRGSHLRSRDVLTLVLPTKYLANATIRKSLAFQMSVLERLQQISFSVLDLPLGRFLRYAILWLALRNIVTC